MKRTELKKDLRSQAFWMLAQMNPEVRDAMRRVVKSILVEELRLVIDLERNVKRFRKAWA